MRQDPPFDLGYITATHLLERIQGETLVVNDPASVRNAPEKVWVLDYAAASCRRPLVTRSLGLARKFLAEHGEIVIKPLHGNRRQGGVQGRPRRPQPRLADRAVQPHLSRAARHPDVPPRDRRRATSASCWSTARSRARSTASPAKAKSARTSRSAARRAKTELTAREEEICAALGPELKRRGLLFVGIDVIGGEWLTEINVTSPTGIVAIDAFNGTDTPALIWDAIERRLGERNK